MTKCERHTETDLGDRRLSGPAFRSQSFEI